MKTLLKLSAFAIVIIVIVLSCKKILSTENNAATSNEFNTTFIKNWYFATLAKGTVITNTKQTFKQMPDWKRGVSTKIGNYNALEFPFYKAKKSIPLASNSALSKADITRLAQASLSKIIFINTGNNIIETREIDYIPDWQYLQTKQFNIGELQNINDKTDFTGRIIVKKWDGTVVSARMVVDGKTTKISGGKKIAANIAGTANKGYDTYDAGGGDGCYTDTYCVYEQQCTDYWFEGYLIESDCGAWEEVDGSCYSESFCDNGGGDTGGGDGSGGDPCTLYGIGCDPPDPCATAQTGATNATNLAQSSKFNTAKNNIQTATGSNPIEYGITFGRDVNGNITMSSMNLGSSSGGTTPNWPGEFADIHNHTNDLPPSPGDLYGLISVDSGHTGFDTRFVVTNSGAVYALVVTDLAKAIDFSNNKFPSINIGFGPDFPQTILDKFDDVSGFFLQQGYSNLFAEERAMAFVLDNYNTGVALLKQDSDGSFKKMQTTESSTNGNITYSQNNCQ